MGRTSAAREFLELLEPVQDALYRHARRAAWRPDQAADMVQEAVMTAWREFGRFQRGTNFRAWMFRILTHTVYGFNKCSARRREAPLEDAEHEWAAVIEREDAWEALRDDPDRLREMLDQRLVRAIEGLGHDERQCFLLRLVEGFSYREIAGMLDMPLGTVMSHVFRARMSLRERLAALAIEEGIVKEGCA